MNTAAKDNEGESLGESAQSSETSRSSESTRLPIVRKDVTLPQREDREKLAFVLYNVYTPEECRDLIDQTETIGYIPAVVNVGSQEIFDPDYRKSARCIHDSSEMAEEMWSRVGQFIPKTFKNKTVVRINERFRFLRYDPGDFFRPHCDGCYVDPSGDRTLLTIQLYLNEDFEGGETTFLFHSERSKHDKPIKPKTGMVLVFQHDIYHEGSLLKSGRKYAVRSDILYTSRKQEPSLGSPAVGTPV